MTGLVIAIGLAVASVALVLTLRRRDAGRQGMPSLRERPLTGAANGPRPGAGGMAPAAGDAKLNWLVGTAGPAAGRSFHIGYRMATIGRAPTNLVQIDHQDVSRKHCQLTPRDGRLQVVDMQSQNGTYVNGAPVANGSLGPGDELRVGPARFVFRIHVAGAIDAARAHKQAGAAAVKSTVARGGGGLQSHIESALRKHGGDVDAAAAALGVDVKILWRIIEEKGITRPE